MITLEVKQLRAVAGDTAAVAISGSGAVTPIFSNVMIVEEEDGRVRFCATDLDTMIERTIEAAQSDATRGRLRCTVSAGNLKAIAAKLPDGAQVTLEADEGSGLKLVAGRSRFKLATLPAEDFPVFPRIEQMAEFDLAGPVLAGLIDRLAFAIGTDPTRYYLGGLYFHVVGDGSFIRIAATDGHRLARSQTVLEAGAEDFPETGVIVPRQALKIVRSLIDHMPAAQPDMEPMAVAIRLSDTRIEFDFPDGTRFTSKLIDGQFPDYSRVIPVGHDKIVHIDREQLRAASERVATIATEKTRIVKFGLSTGLVTLSIASPDNGTAMEEIPADYAGPAIDLGFNVKYLTEVLSRIEGDTVTIEIGDAASATLLLGQADSDTLFVLMPARV